MNKSKLIAALIFGVCGFGAGVANADGFMSFAPLVGDFSAAHAGLETAVPNIKSFDTNLDATLSLTGSGLMSIQPAPRP